MIFNKAQQLNAEGVSFAMITMTGVRGSAPQDLGAKCIVTRNGLEAGTIGGGKIEAHAINFAINQLNLKTNIPETHTWNLQTDIGMTCGGEVTLLFEYFQAKSWPIVIFGAGHVSQALTTLLSHLSCQVTCIDSREDWLSKLNPKVNKVRSDDPKSIIKDFNSDCYFISMTKGHATDVPALKAIADHFPNSPYVGVIGSKIKGTRIKQELKELCVSQDFIDKLIVPIGLPLGSNDPFEIAISIIAQLLEVRG